MRCLYTYLYLCLIFIPNNNVIICDENWKQLSDIWTYIDRKDHINILSAQASDIIWYSFRLIRYFHLF